MTLHGTLKAGSQLVTRFLLHSEYENIQNFASFSDQMQKCNAEDYKDRIRLPCIAMSISAKATQRNTSIYTIKLLL